MAEQCFAAAMSRLTMEGPGTDTEVVCRGVVTRVHALVLSIRSPYFCAVLEGGEERVEGWRRMEVKGPGRSPQVVRMALSFMYGEGIQGQVSDYAALLDLGEFLGMEDFRVEVEGHMVKHQAITPANCRRVCWLANRYRLAGMAERCARYLADHHGGLFGLGQVSPLAGRDTVARAGVEAGVETRLQCITSMEEYRYQENSATRDWREVEELPLVVAAAATLLRQEVREERGGRVLVDKESAEVERRTLETLLSATEEEKKEMKVVQDVLIKQVEAEKSTAEAQRDISTKLEEERNAAKKQASRLQKEHNVLQNKVGRLVEDLLGQVEEPCYAPCELLVSTSGNQHTGCSVRLHGGRASGVCEVGSGGNCLKIAHPECFMECRACNCCHQLAGVRGLLEGL